MLNKFLTTEYPLHRSTRPYIDTMDILISVFILKALYQNVPSETPMPYRFNFRQFVFRSSVLVPLRSLAGLDALNLLAVDQQVPVCRCA